MTNAVQKKEQKDSLSVKSSRFFREVWIELKRTSWPNKEELKRSTMVVIVAVLVFATWIGTLDFLMTEFTRLIGLHR
ncbi:MAG: preprotein translocase subunit SecE [Armatimonadetes bacterium]|nr:preprotein translocase subunit SecE [Armatimonadota bacterium]